MKKILPLLVFLYVNYLGVYVIQAQTQNVSFSDANGISGTISLDISLGYNFEPYFVAKQNKVVIKSYQNGKYDAVLRQNGISFPYTLDESNRFDFTADIIIQKGSAVIERVSADFNTTRGLGSGHVFPPFSEKAKEWLKNEGTDKSIVGREMSGGGASWSKYAKIQNVKVVEVYVTDFKNKIEKIIRDAEREQKEQERKLAEEKKQKEEQAKKEQLAKEEADKKVAASDTEKQTSGKQETQSSQNNTTQQIDMVKVAQEYNAAEKAKSDALNNAADQTFDQWGKGNYIQGAKPLVDEFARQGNATGAYGTMGVAVAAQTGAIIGDAIAARRARKAEEAAYNYELNKGIEAYYVRNYTEALRWYKSSYEQDKNTGAAANGIGCAYFRVKNYTEAKKWLDIAISLNYTSRNTNFCFSIMYLDGLGVPKNENYAFKLMEKATDDLGFNYPEATYHLAFMYLSGRGATQNYKKAYDLFLSISSGGPGTPGHNYNKEIDFALGVMYYYGLGLKKNDDMAKKYFEKCSDNYDAQKMLSKITGINNLYNLSKPNNEITHDTFGKFLNL